MIQAFIWASKHEAASDDDRYAVCAASYLNALGKLSLPGATGLTAQEAREAAAYAQQTARAQLPFRGMTTAACVLLRRLRPFLLSPVACRGDHAAERTALDLPCATRSARYRGGAQ